MLVRAQCRLELVRARGNLRFEIADDGHGNSGGEGFGLAGMRERVESMGGTLVREVADGWKQSGKSARPTGSRPRASRERDWL
jgi:glucose-6-phosphate-specific signal transduction histidine kinase